MSPEIYIDNKLVADVPDETGLHQALDGSPLYVDVNGIDANSGRQILKIEGPAIGGKRIVGLTLEGKGNSNNSKKGGDGKSPTLEVILHERPIRITYKPLKYLGWNYQNHEGTYYNPRWIRR